MTLNLKCSSQWKIDVDTLMTLKLKCSETYHMKLGTKKNILEAFHYCHENNGITCRNLRSRLEGKYKYLCIVIKNPTEYSSPLFGFMESTWKCNNDVFQVYIPNPDNLKTISYGININKYKILNPM